MSWFEVETKIPIDKKEVRRIRKKIKDIANFSKKEKKSDFYFGIEKPNYPRKAFRIRYNGKKYIINFKKWKKKYWGKGIVVKEEFEFELSHKEEFLTLMEELGFVRWMRKLKLGESYNHKKDKRITIELNYVKNLGYFIEIEYLAKKHEIKKAIRKIISTLSELEISKDQIDNTGYTKMLWKKGKKDTKYFKSLK